MSRNSTKVNAHIRYKTASGIPVPGVTTVLSVLSKPALIPWANRLGLQGIDSSKFVDEKAQVGTLAHYLVMCHFRGIEPDTSDYSAKQIDQAENSLLSFFEWEKPHAIKPILVEEPLVSDQHGYGGTVDLYGVIDGEPTLIDFKTGKGIYPEMRYQVAAYRQLLEEHGHQVSNARILRIGRDEDEGFEDQRMGDLKKEWEIFTHCLAIWRLQK
jgi:hypothetical protein